MKNYLIWSRIIKNWLKVKKYLNIHKLLILGFYKNNFNFSVLKDTYLVPPPAKKFQMPKSYLELDGQAGQPIKINEQIFKNKIKNGFFIEAGAYDGEKWSNSLFYEVEKGWNGLLVEAHPEAFIKMKKRVSYLPKCIKKYRKYRKKIQILI